MYLYRISQDENNGWDTFDSAIVAADSAEEARSFHPHGHRYDKKNIDHWKGGYSWSWASHPDRVAVELIGEADPRLPPGVVIASFNAG